MVVKWDITNINDSMMIGVSLALPNCSCIQAFITSNTAQGGGGSFKNRKPIGEVGCCESRMAERIQ